MVDILQKRINKDIRVEEIATKIATRLSKSNYSYKSKVSMHFIRKTYCKLTVEMCVSGS